MNENIKSLVDLARQLENLDLLEEKQRRVILESILIESGVHIKDLNRLMNTSIYDAPLTTEMKNLVTFMQGEKGQFSADEVAAHIWGNRPKNYIQQIDKMVTQTQATQYFLGGFIVGDSVDGFKWQEANY